ncbi:uncharacterized protein LOC128245613 [Mya arenaria]|uniref:uncharacterized protein LOC128245613 n=1 Tax=Mya arenaria TaxID=6604 RepID=UPI0022E6BC48|nr:uncharacterized protein LOC128245613 [Mya arenaria]
MTSSVVVLSLIGAAILLAVGHTDAISCYECSNTDGCKDQFNVFHSDVTTAIDCLSCSKLKVGDTVVRGCEGTSSVEFCAEIESLSSFVCHCNTDYCNSASHVTVSMVTALLLALVAMVFRF